MNRPRNFRVYFLLGALVITGLVVLLREHRPSFLRPGLRLYAYVSTADGNVTVVDLVKLKAFSRLYVGPGPSGMREHPTRAEILGVSSGGGYIWVLNTRANQITSRIPVGPLPYAIDFSLNGNRIFTTTSGNDTLLAIDAQTHAILARAATGHQPVLARVTPDGKSIGRDACKDGLMSGCGPREDGVRLSVNRKKRVVPGSGGEDAIAIQ